MAETMNPKGLVAVFTDEAGNVIATATDFAPDCLGGFKMIEAQRYRVKVSLAWKVIEAYASPKLTRAISEYHREQIYNDLQVRHGCKVTFVAIGYTGEEASP